MRAFRIPAVLCLLLAVASFVQVPPFFFSSDTDTALHRAGIPVQGHVGGNNGHDFGPEQDNSIVVPADCAHGEFSKETRAEERHPCSCRREIKRKPCIGGDLEMPGL